MHTYAKITSIEEALKAVRQNGSTLRFLSEDLRANKLVVLGAVTQSANSLQYAARSLLNDNDFLLQVLKKNGHAIRVVFGFITDEHAWMLTFAYIAVQQAGLALQWLPKLQSNTPLVLNAVRQDGRALEFAWEQLRANHTVVEAALTC